MKIIIHGGYSKTGTTYLQNIVFSQISSVCYLGHSDGIFINDEIRKEFRKVLLILPEWYSPKKGITEAPKNIESSRFYEAIIREILSHENEKIFLLSYENIVNRCYMDGKPNYIFIKEMIKYFKEQGIEAECKIMMTVRNQLSVLKSRYAFSYRFFKEHFNNFSDFLTYGSKHLNDALFGSYKYDEMLLAAREAFGEENVKFFIYEKLNENPVAYIKEILDFIGTDENVEKFDYKAQLNVNSKGNINFLVEEKFDGNFMGSILNKFKREYNKSIVLTEIINNNAALRKSKDYIKSKLLSKRISGEIDQISESDVEKLQLMYCESNKKFERLTGYSLNSYGYYF